MFRPVYNTKRKAKWAKKVNELYMQAYCVVFLAVKADVAQMTVYFASVTV
jgi:hypothetical protein